MLNELIILELFEVAKLTDQLEVDQQFGILKNILNELIILELFEVTKLTDQLEVDKKFGNEKQYNES